MQSAERRHHLWPKVPARFVGAMLAGHSSLGLALAALIYLVALSGTILVFERELSRWEQPEGPVVVEISDEQIADLVSEVYSRAEALEATQSISVELPTQAFPRLQARASDFERGIDEHWVADRDGRLGERQVATPFLDFMKELHFYLFLPRTIGLTVVGMVGIALLASLFSGVLSHPRLFRDAFTLRWGGSKRLQEADLHNRLGIWCLPFHLAVTVTGAILGLSTIILGLLALAAFDGDTGKARSAIAGPVVAADATRADLPPVRAVLEQLRALQPESRITRVRVLSPGTAGQTLEVRTDSPEHLQLDERLTFDGRGQRLEAPPRGVGHLIIGAFGAVHFGWFAGIAVKSAYLVMGLALCVVTAGGVSIWVARRADRGRAVPTWHRVWTAFVWGVPLLLATIALFAMTLSSVPLVSLFLGGLCLLVAGGWFAGSVRAVSRALRAGCACTLATLVGLHALRWGGTMEDPMGWALDGVFLLVTAGLIVSLLPRPAAAAPDRAPNPTAG
ncbi:MAG: PepSY-associated TM helix domain-containing protein [Pseudomonadota bacterium]